MKTTVFIGSIVLIGAVSAAHAAPKNTPEFFKKITKAPKAITVEETSEGEVPGSATEPTNQVVESYPAPGVDPSPTPSPSPAPITSSTLVPVSPSVPGETALRWLMNGNVRYVKNRFRADGRSAKDRERLLTAERPHAIVLAASDSRVPPEIIFDQMLGEIHVVRVLGPSLDSSVIASIEAALTESGPQLLVVLGHTHSPLISKALKAGEGESAGSELIDRVIADIRSRLAIADKENAGADYAIAAALNADGIARELPKRSEIIRKKIEDKTLLIKSALYRLNTGEVTFY